MIKLENSTNGRWYYIYIRSDMLNANVLTVLRGGSGRSVLRHYGYGCVVTLQAAVDRLVNRRIRHGYLVVYP